jgi:hypothetical protein
MCDEREGEGGREGDKAGCNVGMGYWVRVDQLMRRG